MEFDDRRAFSAATSSRSAGNSIHNDAMILFASSRVFATGGGGIVTSKASHDSTYRQVFSQPIWERGERLRIFIHEMREVRRYTGWAGKPEFGGTDGIEAGLRPDDGWSRKIRDGSTTHASWSWPRWFRFGLREQGSDVGPHVTHFDSTQGGNPSSTGCRRFTAGRFTALTGHPGR